MNTRGIVQLVVLNIGVELGVISPMIFAIFVLMATILTFATSPILYLLYRRKYDAQKLSVPNVAEDLQNSQGEINMTVIDDDNDKIQTISNGDMDYNSTNLASIKSKRKSSIHIPSHVTFVTFDNAGDESQINFNTNEEETEDTNYSQGQPRRSLSMTRF